MQPYLNQNYFSQTNPAYNQYMQQYQQPNNYQQNSFAQNTPYVQTQGMVGANMSLPNNLVGRVVDDFNTITANDVPMNGQPATFIKRDGSEIQVRVWTSSGTIATTSYKPIVEDLKDETSILSSDEIKSLRNDFTTLSEVINERFDKVEKFISGRTGRTKKEVSDEE